MERKWTSCQSIRHHACQLYHPYQKCSCSLVVAARGSYVFWCLPDLQSRSECSQLSRPQACTPCPSSPWPPTSRMGRCILAPGRKVRGSWSPFSDVALKLEHQLIKLSGCVCIREDTRDKREPAAYLAVITTEGMTPASILSTKTTRFSSLLSKPLKRQLLSFWVCPESL